MYFYYYWSLMNLRFLLHPHGPSCKRNDLILLSQLLLDLSS
jgi:hypothetical protein